MGSLADSEAISMTVKNSSLLIGGVMFLTGFVLTTYHVSYLMDPQRSALKHLVWAILGVGLFQIGSNLTASGIHDKLS
jgi:vacuolar-type H+-ATPase subunit I/STV1